MTYRSFTIDNSSRDVKFCVCGDEDVTHKFNLKAVAFDNEKGFPIAVKVSFNSGIKSWRKYVHRFLFFSKVKSIDEYDVCTKNGRKVTRVVSFQDSETRTVLVEV